MDSDILYFRRICSGLRKRLPARGAYDIVRRLGLALIMMRDSYRLKVAARYKGTKPPSGKFGYKANPKLLTPRKSLSSIIGMKLPSLNPRAWLRKAKSAVYDFARDYAAPAASSVYNAFIGNSKEYFGSGAESKGNYKSGSGYFAKSKEEPIFLEKPKKEERIKPATSIDDIVEEAKEAGQVESNEEVKRMIELELFIYGLMKSRVEQNQ